MSGAYDDTGGSGGYYKDIIVSYDTDGLVYPYERSVCVSALVTGTVGINTPSMSVEALLSLKRSP
jgi:hypothetical protein